MLPNWVWATAFVVVLAGLSFVSWRWFRDRALVAIVHNGIWVVVLTLIATDLIAYKWVGAAAWVTLALGIVGFNVGTWLLPSLRALRYRRPLAAAEQSPWDPHSLRLMSRGMLWLLLGTYAAALTTYLVNIQLRFGIDALLFDPSSIRSAPGPSYLETVPLPVRLLLYLAPLLFAVLGVRGAVHRPLPLVIRLLIMALLALTMMLMLQRTNLFMAVLLLGSAQLTLRAGLAARSAGPRPPRWRIVAVLAGLALLAFGSFQVVGQALGKTGQQATASGATSQVLVDSGLTSSYVYLTAGVPAFLLLTESDNNDWPPPHVRGQPDLVGDYNPQTWGLVTFDPIVKMIPPLPQWPSNDAFIDTGVSTNVYTWLAPFYRDFRWPGVLIGMVLMGMLIAELFARRQRSPRYFWLQAIFFSTVFLATFLTKINDTLLLFDVIVVLLLTSPLLRTLFVKVRQRLQQVVEPRAG